MRAVVQRVKEARVVVDGRTVGSIGQGLLVFLGVEQADDKKDVGSLQIHTYSSTPIECFSIQSQSTSIPRPGLSHGRA